MVTLISKRETYFRKKLQLLLLIIRSKIKINVGKFEFGGEICLTYLVYDANIPFSTVGRDEKGDKPRSYAICRLLCL